MVSQAQICYHFDKFKKAEDGALFIGLQPFVKEVENKFNINL